MAYILLKVILSHVSISLFNTLSFCVLFSTLINTIILHFVFRYRWLRSTLLFNVKRRHVERQTLRGHIATFIQPSRRKHAYFTWKRHSKGTNLRFFLAKRCYRRKAPGKLAIHAPSDVFLSTIINARKLFGRTLCANFKAAIFSDLWGRPFVTKKRECVKSKSWSEDIRWCRNSRDSQ